MQQTHSMYVQVVNIQVIGPQIELLEYLNEDLRLMSTTPKLPSNYHGWMIYNWNLSKFLYVYGVAVPGRNQAIFSYVF